MEILGMALLLVGGVVSLVGGIWFLIVAFKEHILWGLGSIFIPFVSLIFLIMYWDDAKRPFLVSLLGTVLAVIGVLVAGENLSSLAP